MEGVEDDGGGARDFLGHEVQEEGDAGVERAEDDAFGEVRTNDGRKHLNWTV